MRPQQSYQSALDLEPITGETRALIIVNMACTYDDLYRSTEMIEYLKRGYEFSLQAIRLSKVRANSNALLNAAIQYLRLCTADDSQVVYLSQGINLIHQALGFARKTKSSEWSQMCLSAGLLYELKYRRTAKTEDFTSALVMYVETWRFKTAPLGKRLRAIKLDCDLLIQKERWSEARKVFTGCCQACSVILCVITRSAKSTINDFRPVWNHSSCLHCWPGGW
jgi:hypothetical protein